MRPTRFRLANAPSPPAPGTAVPTEAKPIKPAGSAFDALEHTGLPTGWLRKPKLPGRNWLIFYGVVSTLGYLYWDDRRKCRAIKAEYIEKVKHLAEVPLGSMELPRKVDVYACKWPGDEEYDRSLKFFKRYVKPILVAAAIDYAPKNGNQYGAISDLVRDKAKEQRRIELGIFPPPSPWTPPTSELSREAEHQRWLEGGTILIGRHTFKEYMHGLQRGWTESLVKVDDEEALANRLADDGRFDEIEEPSSSTDDSVPDEQPAPVAPVPTSQFLPPTPTPQSRPPNSLFAPLGGIRQPPKPRQLPPQPPSSTPSIPDHLTQAPHTISQQPPLLLVYYPNRLGFLNIPLIIADFFNERKNVRIGCEAAYKLVMNETRPIIPPSSSSSDSAVSSSSFVADDPENKDNGEPSSSSSTPVDFAGLHGGDLDFAADSESNYGKSFAKLPASISKARESYYAELPAKLALARSLARNERPPTKDEEAYPPSTEVELRAQRLTKEKRWTGDEAAWKFLRAGSGVAWDERFRDALRVFQTPARSDSAAGDSASFEGSTTSSAN